MTRIFGKLHSFNDKPALIEYNDNCEVLTETWCYDGYWHRVDDKPARINYTDVILSWRYMDTRHRNDENKYSVIQIDLTGKRILWDRYYSGGQKNSGFCPIDDPDEYAKELFNYISRDKIDDYIKRRVG
jgi:hypothetical protein